MNDLKKTQQLGIRMILNLIKVRDELGFELAGNSDSGETRKSLSPSIFVEEVEEIIRLFPDLSLDTEMMADLFYVPLSEVQQFFKMVGTSRHQELRIAAKVLDWTKISVKGFGVPPYQTKPEVVPFYFQDESLIPFLMRKAEAKFRSHYASTQTVNWDIFHDGGFHTVEIALMEADDQYGGQRTFESWEADGATLVEAFCLALVKAFEI